MSQLLVTRPALWTRWWRCWARPIVVALIGVSVLSAAAQPLAIGIAEPAGDIHAWLDRLHAATRYHAYSGTFVVTRDDEMATARIVHVCDGRQQIERIETLNGPARITWRRDDEVMTMLPDKRWAVRDRRELLRLFPGPLRVPGIEVADFYRAELRGSDRLAGFDAWVVEFQPRDALRYGYRIWSEKRTGLVLKLQTLGTHADVLEQVAFTELQFDIPVQLDELVQQMENTSGYRVERPTLRKTTLQAEGWRLKREVPGFRPIACWMRAEESGRPRPPLQCVYSDGLASVSLFFSARDSTHVNHVRSGATLLLSQRIHDHAVTALGEVPQQTLVLFLEALERIP